MLNAQQKGVRTIKKLENDKIKIVNDKTAVINENFKLQKRIESIQDNQMSSKDFLYNLAVNGRSSKEVVLGARNSLNRRKYRRESI